MSPTNFRTLCDTLLKLALIIALVYVSTSCNNDDPVSCDCKHAMYENAATGHLKAYENEPYNCDTGKPFSEYKENGLYAFRFCKNSPTY